MRKAGSGCIINATSMAGLLGLPLETSYSGTKHAVILSMIGAPPRQEFLDEAEPLLLPSA